MRTPIGDKRIRFSTAQERRTAEAVLDSCGFGKVDEGNPNSKDIDFSSGDLRDIAWIVLQSHALELELSTTDAPLARIIALYLTELLRELGAEIDEDIRTNGPGLASELITAGKDIERLIQFFRFINKEHRKPKRAADPQPIEQEDNHDRRAATADQRDPTT